METHTLFSEDCPVCGTRVDFTVKPVEFRYNRVILQSSILECPRCASTFTREYVWDCPPTSEKWIDVVENPKENGWADLEDYITNGITTDMSKFERGDRVYKTTDLGLAEQIINTKPFDERMVYREKGHWLDCSTYGHSITDYAVGIQVTDTDDATMDLMEHIILSGRGDLFRFLVEKERAEGKSINVTLAVLHSGEFDNLFYWGD